jgi:Ca-activated chloride channel family protein
MHFQHPIFLVLLVIPMALAVWTLVKSGATIDAPLADGVLRPQRFAWAVQKAGALIPSLLLACFVVILARPVAQAQIQGRSPVRATNIEVLLNASRSMLAESEIGAHCRYCAAKAAIRDFVAQREGNTMGISIFGSRHLDLVPLTADLSAVVQAIDKTFPDYIALEIAHTKNFPEALNRSIDKLEKMATPDSEQILILVTDGELRDLARHEAELRKRLLENRIILYVAMIGQGSLGDTLGRLAASTPGGRLFECHDSFGFLAVMRHIDRLNKIEYQLDDPIWVDNNFWPLLGITGLSFLLAGFLASPYRPTPW